MFNVTIMQWDNVVSMHDQYMLTKHSDVAHVQTVSCLGKLAVAMALGTLLCEHGSTVLTYPEPCSANFLSSSARAFIAVVMKIT